MFQGIILMTILSSIGNLSTITGSFNGEGLGLKALCMGDERLIINLNSTGSLLTTDFSLLSVSIYDVAGRLIKRFNHLTNSPFNQIHWNGTDDNGKTVSNGIYFVVLENGSKRLTEKLIVLR